MDGYDFAEAVGDHDAFVEEAEGEDVVEEDEPSASGDEEDDDEGEDEDEDEDGAAPVDVPAPESQVVKIVPADERLTSDFISANELAQVLACRAKQIAEHADIFLPPGVEPASRNPVLLAMQEFQLGMCPLKIQRTRSRGPGTRYVEEYAVRELRLIQSMPEKEA